MEELEYLDRLPATRRIKVQALKVGMRHVLLTAAGKYEIAHIRGLQKMSNQSMQIDMGPIGHANRIVALSGYVDIAIVMAGVTLISCPKCHERAKLETQLHPGIAFVSCKTCGHQGPGRLPHADEGKLLAAVVRAWNDVSS